MLDRLHLFIPFKAEACKVHFWTTEKRKGKVHDVLVTSVDLKTLGVPLQGSISLDAEGNCVVGELRHPFESVPSSYTDLTFKVFHESWGFRGEAGIELKASPAKLMQGHNLFGPTSIKEGAIALVSWLERAYPAVFDKLNMDDAEVLGLDCTYSARMPNERTAQQVIDALRGISNGQTKSRGDNYKETAYWGAKNSRLKKLKFYLKQYEYESQLNEFERLANGHGTKAAAAMRTLSVMGDPKLIEWSKCLLRFEASAFSRYLSRRRIPTNLKRLCQYQTELKLTGRCLIRELWQEMTKPIFQACEGMTMQVIDDAHVQDALKERYRKFNKHGKPVYTYANNVFNTFRNIRQYGWEEAKVSTAQSTWTKHTDSLSKCGISKIALQKLRDIQKNNVVPLIRFIEVDFSSQRPAWYVEPKAEDAHDLLDLWEGQQAANDPHLQWSKAL